MRARWLLLTTTLAVTLGGAPASALAATYTIFRTSDTSPASGRCFTSHRLVCSSLRAFVLHAPSNSTAQLSAGTYALNGGKLLFNRPGVVLTIHGAPGGSTIQQTTSGSRVIEVVGETVILNDLTVTGGNVVGVTLDAKGNGADVGGGGISNNGNLILETTTVSGNSVTGATGAAAQSNAPPGNGGVARGGGIDNVGTLAIHNSTIEGNTATGGAGGDGASVGTGGAGQGGGVSNDASGTLLIGLGTTVVGNKATGGASGSSGGRLIAAGGSGAGGGLWSEGTTYLSTDTFTDNLAQPGASASTPSDTYGGAIYADDGTLEVQASTIANNQATTPAGTVASGGGGVATNVPTTIENSTITGNTSSGSGGGVHAYGDDESIVSSTLSANTAGAHGGNLAASKSLNVGRTIIAGGSAPDGTSNCTGAVTDQGHNLESTTPSQCGLTTGDGDVIGADPALGPLASNGGLTQTMALMPGSPAIDAGGSCTNINGYALTVDQRASQRGEPCDVGAFEIRVTPSNQGAPSVTGTARAGQWLRCNPGTWSSPDSITYFYSWLRDGRSISRALSASYRVTGHDAGQTLGCRVTTKNDDGYSAPQNSASVRVA
jgi:hypothetical protein